MQIVGLRQRKMRALSALAILLTLGGAVALARGAATIHSGVPTSLSQTRFSLANGCFSVRAAGAGYVRHDGGGYRAGATRKNADRFFMKASRLGAYLIYDQGKGLPFAADGGAVERRFTARPGEVFAARSRGENSDAFTLHSLVGAGTLAVDRRGRLVVGKARGHSVFHFVPAARCTPYPEASVDAEGTPFRGTRPDGTVKGWVDSHLHITADERAGGSVISGRPYGKLGITRALGGDEKIHGPDGSADITGNLLRDGVPFGTHDTRGWPSFSGWPVRDTNTHEQVYYRWLERSWMAGERLVVAQTVEDQAFCRLEPVKRHSCSETATIKREVRELHRLQNYVDAQSGGPGRGWFRLVENPAQARRVIQRGKLAVIIGVESSDPFDCSEFEGQPACDRADVDRGIALYKRLGIRSMFIAHWVNNSFAGAALEGGSKGRFIGAFNVLQTGEYFKTGECPSPKQGEEVVPLTRFEQQFLSAYFPKTAPLLDKPIPTYPAGRQCNVQGLTKLGRYLVRRLIANHMLIEVDHLSEKAREQVLAITAARGYPVVSSHNGTGGLWTGKELRTLYGSGGYASVTPNQAPAFAQEILGLQKFADGHRPGVGLGSDTGGFASLPAQRPDAAANPLAYPFEIAGVSFQRQQTGQRTFDLNTDGVAHYGLFADVVGDMKQAPGGKRALKSFFRSAESYLETWQLATH